MAFVIEEFARVAPPSASMPFATASLPKPPSSKAKTPTTLSNSATPSSPSTGLESQDHHACIFRDDVEVPNAFGALSRYEARAERSFYKALRELKRLQAERPRAVNALRPEPFPSTPRRGPAGNGRRNGNHRPCSSLMLKQCVVL